MSIFSVLSQHVDWLSQRHAVAARNVANIDTPGFKAQKIAAFQSALGQASGLALTPAHGAQINAAEPAPETYETSAQQNPEVKNSGNDVSIDKEMAEVGETSRQFAADMNLEKIFQRMFLASVKG